MPSIPIILTYITVIIFITILLSSQVQDLTTQEGASLAIICILRDLRGITASSYNRRTYNLLFDALYPTIFPLLNRVATQLYEDPLVMTAVMKFMQEFVRVIPLALTFCRLS